MLHGFLEYPPYICYLHGVFVGGKWAPKTNCLRRGTKLKLRLLPTELYPLGPAFMFGRLHCSIILRDEQYLEQYTTSVKPLPSCSSENSSSEVIVVHGAGLLDISKIYFFRDRSLWHLNETKRFQDRVLVSLSQESSEDLKSLTWQAIALAQQVAWTIAIEGDLVLPLFDCSHLPNAVEVWKVGERGKCPLDLFIRLSRLSSLLADAQMEQTNRKYNNAQTEQLMYNGIAFVENSILSRNRTSRTIADTPWLAEMWGNRLVLLNISMNANETLKVRIRWNDGKGDQNIICHDSLALARAIATLRQMRNFHLHITGISQHTSRYVLSALSNFIQYPFGDFETACNSIRDALFCNPWQIFFDKFPVYYHGTIWNIEAPADRCGIQSVC